MNSADKLWVLTKISDLSLWIPIVDADKSLPLSKLLSILYQQR